MSAFGVVLFGFGVIIMLRGFWILIKYTVSDVRAHQIIGAVQIVIGVALIIVGYAL